MNWLLGTQGRYSVNVPHWFLSSWSSLGTRGRYSVNVPHWFLSSWGILGTRGGFLMIALHWFLHLSRLLGTGRRFPVIVLHILEKAGRTNLMKGTAVPNYPEYSEKQGEQTWWKGQPCLITRNTAKNRENKHDERDSCAQLPGIQRKAGRTILFSMTWVTWRAGVSRSGKQAP